MHWPKMFSVLFGTCDRIIREHVHSTNDLR